MPTNFLNTSPNSRLPLFLFFLLLLVPILVNSQVAGLVEVWQAPDRHPSAIQGFMQFLIHMAELASRYLRHRLLGEMTGQQQLWPP